MKAKEFYSLDCKVTMENIRDVHYLHNSKACAIIHVKGIIDELEEIQRICTPFSKIHGGIQKRIDHWQSILRELEK